MSYTTAQRTHEIGIRSALGASRPALVALIVRDGFGMVGLGVGLGVGGALLGSRLLEGLLYGVRPTDVPTLVAVVAGVVLAAGLAMWMPARRATRVEAMEALRVE